MKFKYSDNLLRWCAIFLTDRLGISTSVRMVDSHIELLVDDGKKEIIFLSKLHQDYSNFLFFSVLRAGSISNVLSSWRDVDCFFLTEGIQDLDFVFDGKSCYSFNYDFLYTIVSVVNRFEEYDNVNFSDRHLRFSVHQSLLRQEGLYEHPVVDYIILLLQELLKSHGVNVRKDIFSVDLSCDVDNIYRYKDVPFFRKFLTLAKDLFKDFKLFKVWLFSKDGDIGAFDAHQNFDYMMEKADEIGLPICFNFICGNSSIRYDYRYNFSDSVKKLLREIFIREHQVGIHFSYNALKRGTLKNEWSQCLSLCKEFNYSPKSGRFHYLNFRFPELICLEKVQEGFVDTSLTFFDGAGFRSGTCFPFQPFSFLEDRAMNIILKPLVIMEGSVLGYEGLGSLDFVDKISRLLKRCLIVKGNFSMLWHNSDLSDENKSLFETTLKLISNAKSSTSYTH